MADPAPARATPARLNRGNVAVVIHALNEALRIREVVRDALAHCDHVIVVDDGSDDGTADCIADLGATLLRHPRRLGKGAALRSGFAEARRIGAQAVTTMDGDGQHAGADIPRLVDAANRHPGCVIVGARLRKRATQPVYRRIGNDFGDWGIAWGCGFRLIDSQSGQRLYPHAVYTLDDVPGEGFVFVAQMVISASRRAGACVVAVPFETRYATAAGPVQFR
jgi:glycosyltransferase involved in cell wall biosynthesis